jgi:hypothetical protein
MRRKKSIWIFSLCAAALLLSVQSRAEVETVLVGPGAAPAGVTESVRESPSFPAQESSTDVNSLGYYDETVLGAHSPLTNEGVAAEYQWIKDNIASEFMPYVIEHAEGNPNVIHFLYMWGQHAQSPDTFEYTDEEREAAIPLLMQWDYRWGFPTYGGGPAGLTACAPTCMAMIGFGLTGDESINPRSMYEYSAASGFWVSGQGTSWSLVTNAFPKHSIYCTQISATQDAVAYELSQGHPVLINVGIGKFSAVGHFMVLAGVAQDGTFILNDPNNLENSSKTWSWADLSTEITAAWSYSYAGS